MVSKTKERKRLAIGCDHAGYGLKEVLKEYALTTGYEIDDVGTYSCDSVDYPDFAHNVANKVSKKEVDVGVLMCGSGNGINITANKHKNIRSALCWNEETATLARQHNDANILVLPAKFVAKELAKKIFEIFLSTLFEGGRHERRIRKIEITEEKKNE